MADKKISFDELQKHLKENNALWHAAANTGNTNERGLGYDPGPGEESLVQREKTAKLNHEQFMKMDRGAFGFPVSFDLRNVAGQNYMTSIKNQGGCGSCVAFGTIGALEGTVRFQRGNAGLAVDYSEAQMYYCYAKAEGRTCASGWYPDSSFAHLQTGGVVDEACFPYTAGDQNCNLCSDYVNRLTKISAWHKITNVADMKTWISTKGPVGACFTVYEDFYHHYSSGVYHYVSGAVVGGHCITVVGYDDANKYWICKNQWGNWGEAGYFRIGYGQCGIDSAMWAIDSVIETGWVNGVHVQGLWANNADSNVWAFIETLGWRKLGVATTDSTMGMLTLLASSKGAGRTVSVYLNNGLITSIYGT